MRPKFRSLLIKILIVTGIDSILFSVVIICWRPTADESTIELLLLMAIFVINIGLAVAFRYTIRSWYLPLVLNSIIAAVVFHLMLMSWYVYQGRGLRMQFMAGDNRYELVLSRKDTLYNFYEKYSDGSSNRFMSGQYKMAGDTVYLTDPVNQMIVYKDTLIGFAKDKIVLKRE